MWALPPLASVRPLLGPSWIIEDPERYEKVLAEVGAAAQPIDFIDWGWSKISLLDLENPTRSPPARKAYAD